MGGDKSNTNEIIPISFIYTCPEPPTEYTCVVMRGKSRQEGVQMPIVHGANKQLNPNVKPEHQKVKPVPKQAPQAEINQKITKKLVERSKRHLVKRAAKLNVREPNLHPATPIPTNIPQIRTQDNFPVPTLHVPPFMHKLQPILEKPKDISLIDASYDPLMDVDSPFYDVLIKIEYRHPTESDFIISPSLEKQIDQGQISKWDLPCQKGIDKIMT